MAARFVDLAIGKPLRVMALSGLGFQALLIMQPWWQFRTGLTSRRVPVYLFWGGGEWKGAPIVQGVDAVAPGVVLLSSMLLVAAALIAMRRAGPDAPASPIASRLLLGGFVLHCFAGVLGYVLMHRAAVIFCVQPCPVGEAAVGILSAVVVSTMLGSAAALAYVQRAVVEGA